MQEEELWADCSSDQAISGSDNHRIENEEVLSADYLQGTGSGEEMIVKHARNTHYDSLPTSKSESEDQLNISNGISAKFLLLKSRVVWDLEEAENSITFLYFPPMKNHGNVTVKVWLMFYLYSQKQTKNWKNQGQEAQMKGWIIEQHVSVILWGSSWMLYAACCCVKKRCEAGLHEGKLQVLLVSSTRVVFPLES